MVTGDRMWCDCVGEGKPFDAPTGQEHDHALSQVVMSAVACIYFQISLGKAQPEVLAFTLNRNLMRFFVVVGVSKKDEEGKELWGIKYCHVEDRDLDLKSIGSCVRSKALAKTLKSREASKVDEFCRLKMAKEGGKMEKWWVEKKAKRTQPLDDSAEVDEKGAGGGKKDPGPDSGGGGGGYSGGGGGGDEADGGDAKKRRGDQSRSYSQGPGGGISKGKGGTGFGKTHLLSDIIRTLAKLAVSVAILGNLKDANIICSFPSEINCNKMMYTTPSTFQF